MPIHITCPHCGKTSSADESQAGLSQPCPACGATVAVPGVPNYFPASQASDRLQFSLRKMLGVVTVVCALLGLLVALILPAIQTASLRNHRNRCINNLKNLGLSMHNHHDVYNKLPLASSQPRTGRPGSVQAGHDAGSSWIVGLLPFMEEVPLYDQFAKANPTWQQPAFESSSQPELGCTMLRILICPNGQGDLVVDPARSEYQTYSTPQGNKGLAISTYVVFAASHFANAQGLADPYDDAGWNMFDGNGMFPFPLTARSIHDGLGLKYVTDGTSKTVMLTETREAAYAAWIDGQANWVVGAWQGNSKVPGETGAPDGFLGWPDSDTTSRTSLGLDPTTNPNEVYLSAARFGSTYDRTWGPSSEHPNGAVNHVFVDGHVQTLLPTIDRNLYLRIISRDGGELVKLDD